jgi:hypothetical protein
MKAGIKMKDFFLKIAQTLVAAAIVANVALLWRLNERVSRIETRLGIVASLTPSKNETQKVLVDHTVWNHRGGGGNSRHVQH